MTDNPADLATIIQQFTNSVKSELEKTNGEFHAALNGDEALSFKGLGVPVEQNEYMADKSDVLLWHDPQAYFDEKSRWEDWRKQDQYRDLVDYLTTSEQINIFSKLVESLKRRRVTPFIGAGLSKSVGYPLWGESIQRLIRKLEGVSTSDQRADQPPLEGLQAAKELVESGRYIEATQLLYEKQKTQLEHFIFNTFDAPEDRPIPPILQILPTLTDGCIVTTNFDPIIERAFLKANRPIEGYMHGTQSQNQFAARLIQGDRCILKLHGHFNSAETYIFSEAQYDAAYGNINGKPDYTKPLAKVLRQIFISHTMLFLGCSLEADRTLTLFEDIVSSNGFDVPDHYALLPKPAANQKIIEKENLLSKSRIRPIWYEVVEDENGNKSHQQMEQILNFAADCMYGKARM